MDSSRPVKPNLEVFAEILLDLARKNRDLIVVTGDSRGSGKLTEFGKLMPDHIVEVGIAEQNLVGVSAGLASTGKKVFSVSPACFLTTRALEQIKNDVAYSNNPVKLIGISAGVSYGALGATHHSIHDFAVLRTINNIDIVAPADNFETEQAVLAALDYPKPIYIRFGKKAVQAVHNGHAKFVIGKAIPVKDGGDVTFVATGETVSVALMASNLLEERGIHCSVISVHTIKPLDEETIINYAEMSKAMITVEEHSISGGLGSACASLLLQKGICIPLRIMGFPDQELVTGNQQEIFSHYGLDPDALAKTAEKLLEKGA